MIMGSNLSGKHIGLSLLLENEIENYFMDLEDLCHSLNLTLVKSLQTLPNNFTEFFRNIQNHFAWPQRVALLKKMQEENNKKKNQNHFFSFIIKFISHKKTLNFYQRFL